MPPEAWGQNCQVFVPVQGRSRPSGSSPRALASLRKKFFEPTKPKNDTARAAPGPQANHLTKSAFLQSRKTDQTRPPPLTWAEKCLIVVPAPGRNHAQQLATPGPGAKIARFSYPSKADVGPAGSCNSESWHHAPADGLAALKQSPPPQHIGKLNTASLSITHALRGVPAASKKKAPNGRAQWRAPIGCPNLCPNLCPRCFARFLRAKHVGAQVGAPGGAPHFPPR